MNITPFRVPAFNAHYEGHYDGRDLQWRRLGAADKASHIASLLGQRKVASILEVGCGTGAVIAAVAALGLGSRHVGVDLADPTLHRDASAAGLDLQQFDGKQLPFADDSFDLVFASHVLEHVLEPRSTLYEMKRVAAKWMYLEVPCELHARTSQRELQRTLDIGHINAYTPESFQLLLESCGLSVECLEIFDHSLAVHQFNQGPAKAWIKYGLRRGLLAVSPRLASRVFTYHCGALVTL